MSNEKAPDPQSELADKLARQLEQWRAVQTTVITPEDLFKLRNDPALAEVNISLAYYELMSDITNELMGYLQQTLTYDKSTARALIDNSGLWHILIGSSFDPERCIPPANDAARAALGIAEITLSVSVENFLRQHGQNELADKYFTSRS